METNENQNPSKLAKAVYQYSTVSGITTMNASSLRKLSKNTADGIMTQMMIVEEIDGKHPDQHLGRWNVSNVLETEKSNS